MHPLKAQPNPNIQNPNLIRENIHNRMQTKLILVPNEVTILTEKLTQANRLKDKQRKHDINLPSDDFKSVLFRLKIWKSRQSTTSHRRQGDTEP